MNDYLPSILGAVMRGTTPTIVYDLGFDVSEVSSLILYFMQGNKVRFTKSLADCDAEDGLIYTTLTQNDTYKLSAKKRLEVRCRFKRNNYPVVGVLSSFYDVYDTGKPEEIIIGGLPAYIRITTLPSDLEYAEGEPVSIDGIVVKAYYGDGTEWGIVPFDELLFEPSTATALPAKGFPIYNSYLSLEGKTEAELDELAVRLLPDGRTSTTVNDILFEFADTNRYHLTITNLTTGETSSGSFSIGISETAKKWVWATRTSKPNRYGFGFRIVNRGNSGWAPWNLPDDFLKGGHMTITVSWPRPHDGRILTDTYDITVS
jgi:hypothetical protein